MTNHKKNILRNFWLLSVAGLIVLSFFSYRHWLNVNQTVIDKQKIVTQLASSSTTSIIRQYESILTAFRGHFNATNNVIDNPKVQNTFDQLLTDNPNLAAFSLYHLKGKNIVSSSNWHTGEYSDHHLSPATINDLAKSEQQTVIGRTYFSEELQRLVIPMSQYIRNAQGQAIYIIQAAIKESIGFDFISDLKQLDQSILIWLLRADDGYVQLIPRSASKDAKLYQNKIPRQVIDSIKVLANLSDNQPWQQLRDAERIINFTHESYLNDVKVMSSFQYLPQYRFWLVTQTPYQQIVTSFQSSFAWLVCIYLLFLGALVVLCRQVLNTIKSEESHYLHEITIDPLTQLRNKRYMLDNENNILKPQRILHYFFIDFSNFKSVNENFNYIIGDTTLIEIGNRLRYLCTAEQDLIVRYSGSEFIIICQLPEELLLEVYAQSLIDWLSKPYLIDESHIVLDLNIGIAQYPLDAQNLTDLRQCARLALSAASNLRNATQVFSTQIHDIYQRDFDLRQALKTALLFDELSMLYQPQINQSDEVIAVEALARWNNQTLGSIAATEFIHIAEQTGYIYELGLFFLQRSLNDIKGLQSSLNYPLRLSVNISVKQLGHPNFFKDLENLITLCKFPPSSLTIEITKGIVTEQISVLIHTLNQLKNYGVTISLDNFGAGSTSLISLKKLPINEIKLDRQVVQQSSEDPEVSLLLANMITLAKELACSVVGQGIETDEQQRYLKDCGCDLLQGNFIAAPMDAEKLFAFIAHKHYSKQLQPS